VGRVSRSVVSSGHAGRSELAEAFSAAWARLGLVAILLALAALAWWLTAVRMAGMEAGPGTDIGALGWFLGVWVVMMAAMMYPSLAPTVALYARMTRRRGLDHGLLFAGGYLLVWGGAGLGAYGLFRIGRDLFGGDLAWHAGGRWFAAGVLAVAALYEVTPLKDVCLAKCRSPIGFLLGSWRDGRLGALEIPTSRPRHPRRGGDRRIDSTPGT
jgi:predicted metal-binding membrane protein